MKLHAASEMFSVPSSPAYILQLKAASKAFDDCKQEVQIRLAGGGLLRRQLHVHVSSALAVGGSQRPLVLSLQEHGEPSEH